MRLPLLDHGIVYANDLFLRANPPKPVKPDKVFYAGDGNEPPYDKISAFLELVTLDPSMTRTVADGKLGATLHQLLPITRRAASDMRFWHYLSMVRFPDYVSWRYYDSLAGQTSRVRYLGTLDENAFARLWWWAELTVSRFTQDPYEITLKACESFEFFHGVLRNLCGGNHFFVRCLYRKLFTNRNRPSDQLVREIFIRVNGSLVTVAIDALSEPDIESLIDRICTPANL
ncbi:MAG TPA: DUF6339 family protein [Acidobacteriota bacterium]|nr:DUF6339 family protein [Acidobacteriota bacterium]